MQDPGMTGSSIAVIAALYIGVPVAVIALQFWYRRSRARKQSGQSPSER